MEVATHQKSKHLRSVKDWWTLFKATYSAWSNSQPFRQSAVIAYYAIFSLPALLVIIIAIASLVFGQDAVSQKIYGDIASTMGQSTAKDVQLMIESANSHKDSILAIIIGACTLVIGSIGVFEELHTSLNIVWNVRTKQNLSIWKKLRMKVFSFGLVMTIGFLLLVSLVLTALIAALSKWVQAHFPDQIVFLLHFADILLSMGIITLLFAMMFKILPDAKVKWRYVWKGAILTSFLFLLGKYALGIYFGKANPASAYGAAGSIVLILLWVNYSSLILFFGAEFTKQFALFHGGGIEPSENGEMLPDNCWQQ